MSTTGYRLVSGWSIDRGRNYELDKTETGTATIQIVDTTGKLDPTNSSSPFNGSINPMKQAGISLQNPVDGVFYPLFRGFTSNYSFDLDISEKVITGKIECEDLLGVLARTEVVPGGSYGTTVPSGSEGNVYYAAQSVQDRIKAALADAGIPSAWTDVFTGNVNVQGIVYPPRQTILSVIDDAADAEFPGVANRYISKEGIFTFHGRLARFNPTVAQYNIGHWYCGDMAAVAGGSNVAPISSLQFDRDAERIYNAVLSTPQNIADADIAGQQVSDSTSITAYGTRSLSFENLVTSGGKDDGLDANQETKLYATYYVDNYKDPRNRINQVTFRPRAVGDTNATYLWRLLCNIELGDLLTVTTTHPGGGGFNEDFYVEGLHYEADNLLATPYTNVTLTVDLSPKAYYSVNPF